MTSSFFSMKHHKDLYKTFSLFPPKYFKTFPPTTSLKKIILTANITCMYYLVFRKSPKVCKKKSPIISLGDIILLCDLWLIIDNIRWLELLAFDHKSENETVNFNISWITWWLFSLYVDLRKSSISPSIFIFH